MAKYVKKDIDIDCIQRDISESKYNEKWDESSCIYQHGLLKYFRKYFGYIPAGDENKRFLQNVYVTKTRLHDELEYNEATEHNIFPNKIDSKKDLHAIASHIIRTAKKGLNPHRPPVYIIRGEPGCGKTTTINYITTLFKECFKNNKIIWIRLCCVRDLRLQKKLDPTLFAERLILKTIEKLREFYEFNIDYTQYIHDIFSKNLDYAGKMYVFNELCNLIFEKYKHVFFFIFDNIDRLASEILRVEGEVIYNEGTNGRIYKTYISEQTKKALIEEKEKLLVLIEVMTHSKFLSMPSIRMIVVRNQTIKNYNNFYRKHRFIETNEEVEITTPNWHQILKKRLDYMGEAHANEELEIYDVESSEKIFLKQLFAFLTKFIIDDELDQINKSEEGIIIKLSNREMRLMLQYIEYILMGIFFNHKNNYDRFLSIIKKIELKKKYKVKSISDHIVLLSVMLPHRKKLYSEEYCSFPNIYTLTENNQKTENSIFLNSLLLGYIYSINLVGGNASDANIMKTFATICTYPADMVQNSINYLVYAELIERILNIQRNNQINLNYKLTTRGQAFAKGLTFKFAYLELIVDDKDTCFDNKALSIINRMNLSLDYNINEPAWIFRYLLNKMPYVLIFFNLLMRMYEYEMQKFKFDKMIEKTREHRVQMPEILLDIKIVYGNLLSEMEYIADNWMEYDHLTDQLVRNISHTNSTIEEYLK